MTWTDLKNALVNLGKALLVAVVVLADLSWQGVKWAYNAARGNRG